MPLSHPLPGELTALIARRFHLLGEPTRLRLLDRLRDVIARSHELPVVVDFWAAWCGPCRMLGPALDAEAAKRTGRLELVKLDVDAQQETAARYGIQSIPTVAVFRDGEIVTGFIGAQPASAIGRFFDEHVLAPAA